MSQNRISHILFSNDSAQGRQTTVLWINSQNFSFNTITCFLLSVPLKKSPSKSDGGETRGESRLTMDFMTISSAFLPYCGGQDTSEPEQSSTSLPENNRLRRCAYFVVEIEPAQVSRLCCSSVPVRKRTLCNKDTKKEV